MASNQQPVQPAPYYPAPTRHRPIGVTILAILQILGGLGLLLLSFIFFGLAALLGSASLTPEIRDQIPQWFLNLGSTVFLIVGVIILIFAIISFLLARGFLKGKRWARTVGIVLAVLEILGAITTAIASGNVNQIATVGFTAIIPIIILLYLMLPNTKAWFAQ
jgi:cytochrome bd-type quinol oxidase subunit 2